ncbi:uncharacterized protein CG3556-like [Palaemon carinicauda]|uniref:uncharacterized protein CG3556-like n=1 Tax=Palaemon carinicauda TaxID=392227 RepID=UPI0035B5D674
MMSKMILQVLSNLLLVSLASLTLAETPNHKELKGPANLLDDHPALAVPALKRAVDYVMAQRHPDYGWGTDTAHTVLPLKLANASWFEADNLEAQLVIKQMELELILRMWKHRELPLTTGYLAVNVMALVALCKDPRSFYAKDLVAMLVHEDEGVDFEVVFAQLATCTSGHHMRRYRLRRLVDIVNDRHKSPSVDTLSIVILALHCAQHQRRHDLGRFIDQALKALLKHQAPDGSFNKSLHSTALALQAMMSSKIGSSWNATMAQEYVMSHQLPDGSFGGLFDTNAVLPILGGSTLLDVALRKCPKIEEDTIDDNEIPIDSLLMPEDFLPLSFDDPTTTPSPTVYPPPVKMINVTYYLWKGQKPEKSFNMSFTVPENTTFFTVMRRAAHIDFRFQFSALHWGDGYYIHTLWGEEEDKDIQLFWRLYLLKESPVPGQHPGEDNAVGTGVKELIVNDGDHLLFWYHKMY